MLLTNLQLPLARRAVRSLRQSRAQHQLLAGLLGTIAAVLGSACGSSGCQICLCMCEKLMGFSQHPFAPTGLVGLVVRVSHLHRCLNKPFPVLA